MPSRTLDSRAGNCGEVFQNRSRRRWHRSPGCVSGVSSGEMRSYRRASRNDKSPPASRLSSGLTLRRDSPPDARSLFRARSHVLLVDGLTSGRDPRIPPRENRRARVRRRTDLRRHLHGADPWSDLVPEAKAPRAWRSDLVLSTPRPPGPVPDLVPKAASSTRSRAGSAVAGADRRRRVRARSRGRQGPRGRCRRGKGAGGPREGERPPDLGSPDAAESQSGVGPTPGDAPRALVQLPKIAWPGDTGPRGCVPERVLQAGQRRRRSGRDECVGQARLAEQGHRGEEERSPGPQGRAFLIEVVL